MRTLFVLVSALLLNTVSSTDICDLNNRQDCGYVGINQQQCESKGCCWNPAPSVAWCFYKSGPPSYYTITQSNPTTNGYQATLQLNTPGGTYGNNIQTLSATLTFETADRVRLRITDPSKTRWEIPDRILPFPKPQPTSTFHYTVSRSLPNLPAWLAITRTIDGVVVFNATDLQFADQFLQLSTMLPDSTTSDGPNLYGLGEHVDPLRLSLDNHVYTLWNVDIPTPVDQNVYGAHPFFMQLLHNSGNAHGIWLRNSNGMDIITSKTKVTYRTIGGILDVYVMLGPSPAAVITQYHDIIGHPHMPPYWSLGWHQCKYGYKNLDEIKGVVDAYAKAQIPLDTMWNDIDYMNKYEDFSFDPINYPQDQMRTFVNKLHDAGQHYVLIIDPGIHNRQGYASYDDGLSRGIFINKSDGVTPFIGKVWPGTTAFPDFLNPDTESYWYDQIKAFLGLVDIDGLWIDMNELSNFDNGASENPRADVNNPPYHINNFRNHAPLNSKTLAMDALHYGGVPEYDAHNLFGFTEAIATNKALEKIRGKRSFVLTRSTFSGSGAHAAHWLGDNQATWQAMAYSIPGILNMNLLGIPFVGVDICGFQDTTTEELCSRWTALGSFYPFARNHHDTSGHQEPYLWESVTRVAKKTLGARYSLLPYYYTLFFSAHQNGGTVARPLWMEYPTDSNTYAIDAQFLIGSGLLISPVLQQGANSVTAYFPSASIWYNYWNGQNQPSGIQTLATGMEEIQVHVRGGTILPCQEPALTTTATRKNPFYLIVALDNDQKADGSVFIDDGESLDIGASSTYVLFNAIPNAFTATAQSTQQTDPLPPLDIIHFWGLQTSVSNVTVNAQSWNKFAFNSSTDILTISGLNLDLKKSFHVEWA